jgi:gliding motility-associated protein GldM
MAGGNVSPRQKMINMMYLVLTALLALNVSAEILKAFHLVELSLARSTENIEAKNVTVMKAIEKYHSEFPTDSNGTVVYNNATKVRKIAGDFMEYLTDLKNQVIAGADGRKEDSNDNGSTDDEPLMKADNVEMHANLFIIQGKGLELRQRINETRENLLALAPAEKRIEITSDLITEDIIDKGKTITWESALFEHTPAGAVVTLLTKMQSDLRNTEAQVLDALKSSISDADFTFDKLDAKIIPNKGTYITVGAEYSADIFVAASSTKQEAIVEVNGKQIPFEDGVGLYKVIATSPGEQTYKGVITVKKPNGQMESFPFEQKYTVTKPLAVISADKMNVVYIGIDNPISVSVPGYVAKDVQVSISPAGAGNFKPGSEPGTYVFNPNRSAKEITVTATVSKDGKSTKMGDQRFRVKQIPRPTPMLGGIEQSGEVPAASLKSVKFVYAVLKDFAFEGISYKPVKYTLIFVPKKGNADVDYGNGQAVTPKMTGWFNAAKKGDTFTLTNILAQGPDGVVPIPTSLTVTIQ